MLAFSFLFALILALPGALSHQFYDLASPHIYLAARQSTKNLTELPQSSIPSVCSANCTQSVITYLSNCSTTECMCDNQTDQSIASCVNCVVTQGNITSDIGKAVIAQYGATCSKFGVTLATDGASRIEVGLVGIVLAAMASMVF